MRRHALDAERLRPAAERATSCRCRPATGSRPLDALAIEGFRIDYDDGFSARRAGRHRCLARRASRPSGNQWFDVSLGVDVGSRPDRPAAGTAPPGGGCLVPAPAGEGRAQGRQLARAAGRQPQRGNAAGAPAHTDRTVAGVAGKRRRTAPASQPGAAAGGAGASSALAWRRPVACAHAGAAGRCSARPRRRPASRPRCGPYQRDGLAWLDFLGDAGLGGILADDMGLGKTVQVLAHILGEKQRGRLEQPALVVAPTSLVGNWQDEAARFAPALKVLVIHGADRADRYDEITAHDLVITTYPLLPRDREQLLEQQFALLVLDEAQAIKNPNSQAARVVREIPATRRLAMTGTPLENHLGELWAQFDAVETGPAGQPAPVHPALSHADREARRHRSPATPESSHRPAAAAPAQGRRADRPARQDRDRAHAGAGGRPARAVRDPAPGPA